jgi:hypothetical protein
MNGPKIQKTRQKYQILVKWNLPFGVGGANPLEVGVVGLEVTKVGTTRVR